MTHVAPFLVRLAADTQRDLLALGRARTYPARAVVFLEDDPLHHVSIIRSGLVKVTSTIADREVVLDVLGPGEVYGELSAVDGGRASASVITVTTTEVVLVPSAAFIAFLAARPDVSMELMRDLTSRLRGASRRQAEHGTLDGIGRVCRRITELMDRFGETCAGTATDTGAVEIRSPLTQTDIAAWAGLSREAVVKAFQSMRRMGWLRTTGRHIVVLAPDAVRRRASEHESSVA